AGEDVERWWGWCVRNRLVAGLLAVIVSLLLGMVVASMLTLREGKRQAEAERLRAVAEAEESRVQEAQKLLLRLGRKRFGPPDPRTINDIETLRDLKRLEQLNERVLEVSSWQQLLR